MPAEPLTPSPLGEGHTSEVDAKIASLKTLRRELNDIIRQCHSGTISECRIIDALGARSRGRKPS